MEVKVSVPKEASEADVQARVTLAKNSYANPPAQFFYSFSSPSSAQPQCHDCPVKTMIRQKMWKTIQSWYMVAFIVVLLTFLQNLHFNNSSIIIFFKNDSQHAKNFFLAINLFLLLILFSHLAFIYLTGTAKNKDSWVTKKESFNCYVFLTAYETIAILFIATFCLQHEKFFNWMNVRQLGIRQKSSVSLLHQLNRVQKDELCCGFENFRDYFQHDEYIQKRNNETTIYTFPETCCSTKPCRLFSKHIQTLTVYHRGCSHRIIKYIHRYTTLTSTTFFLLALIQTIIVVLSFKVRSYYANENEKNHSIQISYPSTNQLPSQYI